jgi:hypothetical protein
MRSQDTVWKEVSGAGNAQRSLPHARRRKHGAAHTRRLGTVPTSKLETRFVFRKSKSGAALFTSIDRGQPGFTQAVRIDVIEIHAMFTTIFLVVRGVHCSLFFDSPSPLARKERAGVASLDPFRRS